MVALIVGSAIIAIGIGRLGASGEVYYPCSYLLSPATAPREGHARAIADLALDMLAAIRGLCDPAGVPLQVRIGAHCGPVCCASWRRMPGWDDRICWVGRWELWYRR